MPQPKAAPLHELRANERFSTHHRRSSSVGTNGGSFAGLMAYQAPRRLAMWGALVLTACVLGVIARAALVPSVEYVQAPPWARARTCCATAFLPSWWWWTRGARGVARTPSASLPAPPPRRSRSSPPARGSSSRRRWRPWRARPRTKSRRRSGPCSTKSRVARPAADVADTRCTSGPLRARARERRATEPAVGRRDGGCARTHGLPAARGGVRERGEPLPHHRRRGGGVLRLAGGELRQGRGHDARRLGRRPARARDRRRAGRRRQVRADRRAHGASGRGHGRGHRAGVGEARRGGGPGRAGRERLREELPGSRRRARRGTRAAGSRGGGENRRRVEAPFPCGFKGHTQTTDGTSR